jgi:hypothetical protein
MYGPRPAILVFALLAALAPGAVLAQGEGKRFAIEGMLGTARVFDGTLTVRQDGQPELTHTASYRSDSFEPPLYYTARLRYLQGRGAWELQITHLKVVLDNTTAEIPRFEISHGHNQLTVNRSWSSLPVTLRVGGGVVITNAESTIRGRVRDTDVEGGYELSGPVVLAGLGKELDLAPWLFASAEVTLTVAWASVSVAGGEADAPATALHGSFGLGVRF